MVKICPKCRKQNPDDVFWCENCNNRLIQNIIKNETTYNDVEKTTEKPIKQKTTLPYQDKLSKKQVALSMLKIPFAIIFAAVLIFSTFYVITNVVKTDFDWEKYGGYPWDENNLPWEGLDFPWTESLTIDDVFDSVTTSQEIREIAEINQDYWFQGDTIRTKKGWTFSLNKVKNFSYHAKVLGYKYYNKDDLIYQPSEIISPMDIFLGFDDIITNPQNYPHHVVSYCYRGVYYQYTGSSGYTYFTTHQTNTHVIPHSASVLNTLKTISLGDVVSMSGFYVNVHATHEDGASGSWTTDTEIGNTHCEVILLDNIIIDLSFS
jgi:hypothetical protein